MAAIGIMLLILSILTRVDEIQKRSFIVGIVFLILGVGLVFEYTTILNDPEIEVYEGAFVEEHGNSRVAPPLPFTWEYTFKDESGKTKTFYLDTFSKKDIFSEEFDEGVQYRIHYETEYKIIVKVEPLSS